MTSANLRASQSSRSSRIQNKRALSETNCRPPSQSQKKKNRYKKFPNKFINACILPAAILKSTPEQYSSLSEIPEIDLCNIYLKSQPSV